MVGGTPKPFACTSEGCSMTFTNEDHLNVHQRKHEMVLNLGIKNINLVADQTPTPTRFLRNCEEVGLFQDLQNVNPFEETFRKAAELVKTGSLPIPILPEDDTLHTPHIFPHLPEENISLYSSKKIEKVSILSVEENEKGRNDKMVLEVDKNETVLTLSSNNDSPDHIYALSINNHKNPTITICDSPEPPHNLNKKSDDLKSCNTKEQALNSVCDKINKTKYRRYTGNINLKSIVNDKINAKLKLQELLLQNKKQLAHSVENKPTTTSAPLIVLQNVPVVNNVPILQTVPITKVPILPKVESAISSNIKSQLKLTNKITKSTRNKGKTRTVIETDNIRKQDLLARNRAAALRCRARKKVFFDSLEQQLDNVNKEKQVLVKENSNLKREIIHLKTLLLAHKECPITKAMNMGQSIPIGAPQIVEIAIENKEDIKIENKNAETTKTITISIPEVKSNSSPKTNVIVWED